MAAAITTLRQSVSATGTLAPAHEADLSFGSSGTVTDVNVAMGDRVTAGQVLARIDPTDLEAEVTQAQAGLDAASAAASAARSAGASSAQIASLDAQTAVAKTALATAASDLAAARLTSPIAGVVAAVNIAVGDQVSGSASGSAAGSGSGAAGSGAAGSGAAQSGSGSAAGSQIVVISTAAWKVNATVGPADIAAVKKGLQAEITPTGTATKVFGTVASVGVVATTSGSSSTFPVTIAVTGKPSGLYAGTSVSISIVTKQISDALTVPTAAVTTENGQTVVHKVSGSTTVTTPVTVGLVSGQTTQIVSGLAEGDQVQFALRTAMPGGRSSAGAGPGGFGGGFGGGTGGFSGGSRNGNGGNGPNSGNVGGGDVPRPPGVNP